MPMNATTLATAIKTQVASVFSIEDEEQLQNFATAVATAIVEHIQDNAVVTVSATVTSGAGAGGTVSGTGTIS